MDRQVNELTLQINRWHKENAISQKLVTIPGVGPMTASAMLATIGNERDFKNGRQLAVWLGILPKQDPSGGKRNLSDISN
ncbi:MAG: transposase [Gammaproteobacteria bacterium]